MRKDRTNPELIRAEVHKLADKRKTRKVMACGHEDYVFESIDATKEVCWACRVSQSPEAR